MNTITTLKYYFRCKTNNKKNKTVCARTKKNSQKNKFQLCTRCQPSV